MKQHKIIGILYLTIAIIGGFSMGYFPLTFININDLQQTFSNLKENPALFKLAIAGDGIVIILELFISIYIYNFFKETDKRGSQIALISRLAMTFIMLFNIVNYITPLQSILYSTEITEDFIHNINTHFRTVYIWQFFFGIHMITLASLVCKHFKLSKVLSFGIMIGGIGYLLDSINHLYQIEINFSTNTANILLGVAALSEISFGILLLLKKKQ